MRLKKGIFVTFEGIEGSGKSTQMKLLCRFLKDIGIDYIATVEPGGTDIGEEIRGILLSVEHSGMTPLAELLLYAASRAQHVDEIVRPSLEKGLVVVCDRFSDSTLAYQGFGRGLDRDLIAKINDICTGGVLPDLTFLLDVDVVTGLKRNERAKKIDRFELEAVEFHNNVREGYRSIAEREPGRVKIIDGDRRTEDVSRDIKAVFEGLLREREYVV